MPFLFEPIGFIRTDLEKQEIPRHWSHSDVVGSIEIDKRFWLGACDICAGDRIYVIFVFHESPPFSSGLLRQLPALQTKPRGIFSIGSPRRPNPIGLSILKVLEVGANRIAVKGIDMFDGTPVLDIKPWVDHQKG
jgi:tRNA (adenine37-N6)-methyltransferase